MNQGKYVFSQLSDFIPQRLFNGIVKKCDGDRFVKHFSCRDRLLCMLLGQITSWLSFRDLIITLEASSKKLYHLGLGESVTRSNPDKANESRNSKIFEEFAYHPISIAPE